MSGILSSDRAVVRGMGTGCTCGGGQGGGHLGTALGKSEVGIMTQHKSQGDLANAQPWAGGRGIKGMCDGRQKAGT